MPVNTQSSSARTTRASMRTSAPTRATSRDLQAQRVRRSSTCPSRPARRAGAEQGGRDVPPHRVDEARADERRREGGTALEQDVLDVAARELRERPRRGRGSRSWSVGAASSSTRAPGGRSRTSHDDAQRLRAPRSARRRRGARRGAGRRRAPCRCRPSTASTTDRSSWTSARASGRGDPPARAVGGGDPAVEGRGRLPGHERPAVGDGEGPGLVERLGLERQLDRRPPRRRRTSTPAARSVSAPPAATGLGSGWANTTRRTPASSRAWEQGPVRPVWSQGSRVTTAVAPAARPAARRERVDLRVRGARTAVVAPRRAPSPSGDSSTAPTRGLGPRGTPGLAARSRARRSAERSRASAALTACSCSSVVRPARPRAETGRRTTPPRHVARRRSRTAPVGRPARVASHPDSHRRLRMTIAVAGRRLGLTGSTDHWLWPGRGLTPPVRTCTDPGTREQAVLVRRGVYAGEHHQEAAVAASACAASERTAADGSAAP